MKPARLAVLGAFGLFGLALFISRLADLGLITGEDFGVGDWKRRPVRVELSVVPKDGSDVRPLDPDGRVGLGDLLQIKHGPTRYPYLWAVEIQPDGKLRPWVPTTADERYGRSTEHKGEILPVRPTIEGPPGRRVLLLMFASLPTRIEQLQAKADAVSARDPIGIAEGIDMVGHRQVVVLDVQAN